MTSHIENRRTLVDRLRRELLGPDPRGDALDIVDDLELPDPVEERKQHAEDPKFVPQVFRCWKEASTGEEILSQDRPCKRYGIGVLYPFRTPAADPGESTEEAETDDSANSAEQPPAVLTAAGEEGVQEISGRGARGSEPEDAVEDYSPLTSANNYLPSAMGLTFLVALKPGRKLQISFTGGRYVPVRVKAGARVRKWWIRRLISGEAEIDVARLIDLSRATVFPLQATFRQTNGLNDDGLGLDFHLIARPSDGGALVTVSVINKELVDAGDSSDEHAVFQSSLRVATVTQDASAPTAGILPYPRPSGEQLNEEEEEIELLYRNALTYAVGHGCAANWECHATGDALLVETSALPTFEVPSVTPEIHVDSDFRFDPKGSRLQVRMAALAGLLPEDDGLTGLRGVINAYEVWLADRHTEALRLEQRFQGAAARHLMACQAALERMKEGMAMLLESGQHAEIVKTAFRLANHAMCLQRVRTASKTTRRFEWHRQTSTWNVLDPHPTDPTSEELEEPTWRPFQIAFLLMTVPSAALANDPHRETVDLIWFPTGGGKTEAYLGLAAFSIFIRRLRALRHGGEDPGVHVVMRYTLRLLTAQQFQRAASLLCAMEHLRRSSSTGIRLGECPFSLGMWTGATPNNRGDARAAFKDLLREDTPRNNIVVLERCPWCRAQMGPVRRTEGPADQRIHILGYQRRARGGSGAETVLAACSDPSCEFRSELPLHFVDEDMYDSSIHAPSMVIGTVDKFAMLAWRPEARRLFGRDDKGTQVVSPPGLILQDELHLIAGPLGTMVGLYEMTVEELCTDRRDGERTRPKIVASTATIRSYRDQVRRLFGRDQAQLFPPPGLDASDSFFSRYAVGDDNTPASGRLFVGVHAPGLGSVQTTQVRVFSSLLQSPMMVGGATERDPWWTLVAFYNSLRELGGGLTLFHSDVPDYLWGAVRQREGIGPGDLRRLLRVEELTGRLEDREVVSVMSKLEQDTSGSEPAVDVCLASNIIEVGVDIDRLSLLTVVGQPKSTAQYIQVTGRIGRRWTERPGLVVTIYGPSKPRDRSHYERFRTYHQQLYAQVEPTSVTPFSPRALERGLHGALAAYIRQLGPIQAVREPKMANGDVRRLVADFAELARERLARVQHGERGDLDRLIARRSTEWVSWQPLRWSGEVTRDERDVPLLRWPGRFATREVRGRSWLTPTSMRNVDQECRVDITSFYSELDGATPDGTGGTGV